MRSALLQALAAVVLLLSACGGGRDAAEASGTQRATRLEQPGAARAPASACERAPAGTGVIAYRRIGGECLRSFTGFDAAPAQAAPQRRALAAATPPPALTATELFDWAEQEYAQYFPTHEGDLTFAPYTYRYYPSTQNYVGVADGQVYVLGPISGGSLLFVGTMSSFACRVHPDQCNPEPVLKPCAAVPSWLVGFNVCTPNADQTGQVASGTTVAYLDSTGSTRGSATYTCNDGTMTQKGGLVCELAAPLACNTGGLTWNVAGNTCTANAGEPTQLASGTSHTFQASSGTVGSISYSCFNGDLTTTAVPTCAPPPTAVCRPQIGSWTVGDNTCVPDSVPAEVPVGGIFTVFDITGNATGSVSFSCSANGLSAPQDAVCLGVPHIQDSFGGDAGPADGSTSGDGTAGDGAPIVGGLVKVVDVNGKQATATTDTIGYFRVKLNGFVPPLVVSVTRPDGVVRRSISTQPLKTNGFIFIAITGLTDKIASDVARAAGFPGPASLTPAMVQQNPDAVIAAVNAMRNDNLVKPLLIEAGINPDTFDPLSTPFRANGTGYDGVLDNLVITTDPSGETIVQSVNCTAPESWTVNGITCTPDEGEETVVPNNSTVIHKDSVGPTTGTVGWTCQKGKLAAPVLPSCKIGTGQ